MTSSDLGVDPASTLEPRLLHYWRQAYRQIDRYLQAIDWLRAQAAEAHSLDESRVDLVNLDTHLKQHRDRGPGPRAAASADLDSLREDQLVDDRAPGFVEAVKLVQLEIKERLEPAVAESGTDPTVLKHLDATLSMELGELEAMFGTVSNAWDELVWLKSQAAVAERRARRIDSWLVALVTEGERFVRDMLGLSVGRLGHELMPELIKQLLTDPELNIPPPAPEQLVRYSSTSEVIGHALVEYMQTGSEQTTRLGERVGRACGFEFYPSGPGFEPGFVTVLRPLGDSSERIWHNLRALRRRVLHGSESADLDPTIDALLSNLRSQELEYWHLVADFVGAFGLRFGFHLLRIVLNASAERSVGRSDSLRHEGLTHKMPAELRVHTMQSLQDRRWPFAWTLSEMALDIEPRGTHGTIQRLNALYARLQMGVELQDREMFVKREEIEALDVVAPRHQLVKRTLLHEFDGIEELLDELLGSDMALDEIRRWPALSDLRKSRQYRDWVAQQDTVS